ncbi:aminoglycoside phosphotransferase family protein [Streptomyces shenzhenensis]|uniref:aminoglycoside phosphotransferase family protein n=1 Tax=Streptomyces shenzhenensis TaxID=943815 RepID=UPI00382C2659
MHANQLTVSPETVRTLIEQQFPEWRSLPVRSITAHGTVNAVFRIGEQFTARFPLQPADIESTRRLLKSEVEAARELVGRTRFPTPEPVALGEPGADYPLPWSVQTWLPGIVAVDEDPGESVAFARDLADLVGDLRAIDTRGRTFAGTGRGGDLPSHDTWMETCFRHSEELLDVPRLRRVWATLRDLPRGAAEDVMAHGDLIPGNMLVSDGRLTGILDVGGFGPADPSLDLVSAWHLLEAGPRQVLRDHLGCNDLEWERGKAWAFIQAMGLVWYYVESNPTMSRTGRRSLERVLADKGFTDAHRLMTWHS